jgi:dihydrofolate reductase
MRQIIVTEFISADGFADVDKLPTVTWNSEMDRFKNDELADSGAMLLGRKTFEIFAGHWPSETGDFAARFNALPKYVASTTLKQLDWQPAELLQGSLPDAARTLKEGSGGNIYVHGSISVAQALLHHGLVDRIAALGRQDDQARARAQDIPLSAVQPDDRSPEPGVGSGYHLHPDRARFPVSDGRH